MSHPVIRDYLRVAVGTDPTGPADAELLARFAATRDEASFELLVWRHAGLIQRICREVLGDHHAAEDAAQAAFLILARKAHTYSGRGSVVGWLYRIARRVAVRLTKDRARCPIVSTELDRVPAAQRESTSSRDELEALCAEVDHLPERYRVPILLCFFEGLTHAEAARRTGWPIGTVAGRLARAKELLARRLSSKGVGVATVILALPAGNFAGNTARAASAFVLRGAGVPGVDPSIYHLAERVLKAMTTNKLQLAAVSTFLCISFAMGWGLTVAASPQSEPQPANTVPALSPVAAQQPVQPKQPVATDRIARAKDQRMSVNALKQIMLAMHNYDEVNKHLPQDIADKNGKPLLSWRVAILPYLEEGALFNEFKRDEAWDSEHNKKLLAKMPAVYKPGFQPKEDTKTYFQVFAGPGTPFEPGQKIKFSDITDGTSNTLGVAEAGSPVEWSKPADIPFDPKKPLPQLELPYKNVFNAAFMDGAVRSFKPNLDPKVLQLLIERADGMIIPDLNKLQAKIPLTKEEIVLMQGVLKENQKILLAIGEQLKEHEKLLGELAKKPMLPDIPQSIDFVWSMLLGDPSVLSEILEGMKSKNEELRKIIEGSGKK
jgi:RNA polymerase sigma factor (sigma-70 family)